MLCMNCDCVQDMKVIYEDEHMKELRCPQCGEHAKWYVDESDIDTQPISPIDENGEDTIITRRTLDEGR